MTHGRSSPTMSSCLYVMSFHSAELKNGRVPEGIMRRIGYWKAEEYQKFTFPASEFALGGILPRKDCHVWILLVRITKLIFCCGRSGWDTNSLSLLLWRPNILTEETEGFLSCIISMDNLVHFPEDIVRFSGPDNFWCFVFKRAVHNYVERSSNQKIYN